MTIVLPQPMDVLCSRRPARKVSRCRKITRGRPSATFPVRGWHGPAVDASGCPPPSFVSRVDSSRHQCPRCPRLRREGRRRMGLALGIAECGSKQTSGVSGKPRRHRCASGTRLLGCSANSQAPRSRSRCLGSSSDDLAAENEEADRDSRRRTVRVHPERGRARRPTQVGGRRRHPDAIREYVHRVLPALLGAGRRHESAVRLGSRLPPQTQAWGHVGGPEKGSSRERLVRALARSRSLPAVGAGSPL